jgi:hypothetical protein
MRKIDKTQILSTKYKKWEAELERSNLQHPKYNSSKFRFYKDIVMNLFYCQNGLCAYTEQRLCEEEFFDFKHWEDGIYTIEKPAFFGQLEHFDESLKAKKNDKEGLKDWLWDNLFMVNSDINTKIKGSKSIDYILKPDNPNYNPFELLQYNLDTHEFSVNTKNDNLTADEKERIERMIETLGLNYHPVTKARKRFLCRIEWQLKNRIKFIRTLNDEFPTVFQFFMLENS